MDKTNDLIVTFTPTGMIPTKEMTSFVPITPNEIIDDVLEATEIGITSVHLHARNFDGTPSYDKEKYAKIISGIRKYAPDLVICTSLSGRKSNEFEHRIAPLLLDDDLKPDMASLTLSSLNFNKMASINSPQMITDIAMALKEKGIKPELEVFDAGMINYAKYLIKKNLISPPYFFSLILGNIACAQADLLHAGVMINDLPEESIYIMGGIGESQLKVNSLAISIGAGVRVGLEDNIWFDQQRKTLAKNIDLIKRIKIIADANERKIMNPLQMREIMGLEKN